MHLCYLGRNAIDEAEIVVKRPDYLAMAQEMTGLAEQVLPRFYGEAQEEIRLLFEVCQESFELANTVAHRVRGAEIDGVVLCLGPLEDAIRDLKRYEIKPEVIQLFEEMYSDLNAWKGELRARGQAPSGPASPPL
jgi:hypothetical protein